MNDGKRRSVAEGVRGLRTVLGLTATFALVFAGTAVASTDGVTAETCAAHNSSLVGTPVVCKPLLRDGRVLSLVGRWSAYNPRSSSSGGFQLNSAPRPMQQSEGMLVSPIRQPCPPGTTSYTGPGQPYSCLVVYSDNANNGHPVGLRQGHADPAGFGLLHTVGDHNIDEHSIATTIVNSAAGISQGNNRFLYGMTYKIAGVGLVSVEVIEDRNPSSKSPDSYALGVLTAYCVGMTRCPDEVDESIEQSTG